MKLSVPLRFVARETPVRRSEPVTVGLPWPRGAVRDAAHFRLIAPDGTSQVLQTNVLDRWPDGSVRWCLFDFLATIDGTNDGYRIEVGEQSLPSPSAQQISYGSGTVTIVNGRLTYDFDAEDYRVICRVRSTANEDGVEFALRKSIATPESGTKVADGPTIFLVKENGPVRVRVSFRSSTGIQLQESQKPNWLYTFGFIDVFVGIPVARVTYSICNTTSAGHPGGNWDLGNSGSVNIRDLSMHLSWEQPGRAAIRVSPERGQPFSQPLRLVEIIQASSGGESWQSVNHVNRSRQTALWFRGYRITADEPPIPERATPIVTATVGDDLFGMTTEHFWENFPKAIAADDLGMSLALFPVWTPEAQELQGGEQKTHVFYVAFGKDTVTDEPMVWCRSPLLCHADPEWYASTGAVPYLTPKASDPNAEYLKLVDQAIEGPDTFLHKREKIDEYGWRHFGDIYADHEAVFWPGPEPMVSHYNNQYDCVAGFLYQFLRSGDSRWYAHGVECADHTCDIDVYHTDGDKAAYNRGLFWHTYHYAPADTGTHRGYPKSLTKGPVESLTRKMDQLGETAKQLQKSYAVGGGPSASHNYNTGLMLAYFLTGNPIYRDTAIDLGRFVIRMDDPSTTVFRWLSRQPTGYATESGGGGYHGPGRASANSVNALLVGHQLTGERAFLDKAEEIIRRVSHPKQNLERLDLLNAELRWFYTMHLQALGRYLDYKIELGEFDRMYAYARLTLLHYARWMAKHERPILDAPEKLQYPTETWAAQDMRKVEVFQYAAKHTTGYEKEKFLERAEWFFRYVEHILPTFPTKSLCRPVVLMMNFGWSRAWWQQHPEATAPEPDAPVSAEEFGEWAMFVPQKAIALRRAKRLALAGAMGFVVAVVVGVWWLVT